MSAVLVRQLNRILQPIQVGSCQCPCHHTRHSTLALQSHRHLSLSRTSVRLSYDVFESKQPNGGAAFPIVILHGVLGSKKNWESLAKRMATELSRRVVTVDARNHGQSEHSPVMSYEAMADDVDQLLRCQLGTDRCDLLGHSMGGRTGISLALSRPNLINKLIVVDVTHNAPPQSVSDTSQTMEFIQLMKDMPLSHLGSQTLSKAKREVGKQMAEAVPDDMLRAFFLTNLTKEDGKVKWRVNLDALMANWTHLTHLQVPLGAQFTGETLFVSGENSNYVRSEDHPGIRAIFPNVSFSVIEGAGHWVHSEKPAEFLQIVLQFLAKTS
ncbi:sn-1-specific diacylglycerol lipase ABHD11-like [Diadema antillarum]|uniref:sn-1-specific diacylglycerol lipase ABHD11-like n=1 Tax=Diadema antillarum TaxID=105358 RepID=UPI003A8C8946